MHSLERRLSKLEPSEVAGRFFVAKAREKSGADRVFAEAGAGPRDTTVWLRVFCEEGDPLGEARFLYGIDGAGQRWGPERVTVDVSAADMAL